MKITIILEKKNRVQNSFPIKICVGAGSGKRVTIPTRCSCSEENFVGDAGRDIVKKNAPYSKQINIVVNALYFEVFTYSLTHSLEELTERYKPQKKVKIQKETITEIVEEYCKKSKYKSAKLSQYALKLIKEFEGKDFDINIIDVKFVKNFDEFLQQRNLKINTINLIHSKIAMFINRAIDNETYHAHNPYRKFKPKKEITEPKPITTQEIKNILTFNETLKGRKQLALDVFKLSFYLCGLNVADLFNIKKSDIKNNYIEIKRKKTNVPLTLYIPPQAQEIANKYIPKYRNELWLSFAEIHPDYETFLATIIRCISKFISNIEQFNLSRKITIYTARYTWATIADKIGIEEKVISKSLGHADISMAGKHYIKYDWDKSKIANEKVINYVLNYQS